MNTVNFLHPTKPNNMLNHQIISNNYLVFKEGWGNIRSLWLSHTTLKITILSFFVLIFLIIWKWPNIPSMIPLWYSKPWGQDQLAPSWWLLILPFFSISIFFFNLLVCILFTSSQRIFTQLLLMTSLVSSLLIFYITVNIINLVT